MTNLTDATIKAYENAGCKRWTKGGYDRLYIDAEAMGLEVTRYNSGNIKSATWQGERISNADANRLMASKVYVDVETGELHVSTNFYNYENPLDEVAQAFVAGIKAEDEDDSIEDEGSKAEDSKDEDESSIEVEDDKAEGEDDGTGSHPATYTASTSNLAGWQKRTRMQKHTDRAGRERKGRTARDSTSDRKQEE